MTEMGKAIIRDYYQSPLTKQEIGKKYKLTGTTVSYIVDNVDFNILRDPDKKYQVIKIDQEQILKALSILKQNGINYDMPLKFELTEYRESKINKIK